MLKAGKRHKSTRHKTPDARPQTQGEERNVECPILNSECKSNKGRKDINWGLTEGKRGNIIIKNRP